MIVCIRLDCTLSSLGVFPVAIGEKPSNKRNIPLPKVLDEEELVRFLTGHLPLSNHLRNRSRPMSLYAFDT